MDASAAKKRILILGGGFGGVATAYHLERLFRRRPDVVKVGLDSETALLLREVVLGDAAAGQQEEAGARSDRGTDGSPLALRWRA